MPAKRLRVSIRDRATGEIRVSELSVERDYGIRERAAQIASLIEGMFDEGSDISEIMVSVDESN